MNASSLTTSNIRNGMIAFALTTGATSLVSACFIVGTIAENLSIIILKSIGCLETRVVQFFLARMKTNHFINRHMGALIATSSLTCTLCIMATSTLSNLHESTADRAEYL